MPPMSALLKQTHRYGYELEPSVGLLGLVEMKARVAELFFDRFEDVRLTDSSTGKPALTAEHVVARLRFFPLLIGRIEIADVLLVRPTVTIVFNADRTSNWSNHIAALARNQRRMRGPTANCCDNTGRDSKARNIGGAGIGAHQDHRVTRGRKPLPH